MDVLLERVGNEEADEEGVAVRLGLAHPVLEELALPLGMPGLPLLEAEGARELEEQPETEPVPLAEPLPVLLATLLRENVPFSPVVL